MAACVCMELFKLCVFTAILLLVVAHKPNMQNVAQSKTCGISSLYITDNERSGNCSEAINGNTATKFPASPPNCIHTAEADVSPFWWVNLGQKFSINTITIYGRNNSLHRMRCVNVYLNGNLVKRFTDINGWNNNKYDIPVGRVGQLVNITRDCDCGGPFINICEVQVWVCMDGLYGANCTEHCGQCAGDSVCHKVNGSCASCQTGFQPPLCKELETSSLQNSSRIHVGAVVGSVVVLIVAAVVVITVLCLRWSRKSGSQQQSANGISSTNDIASRSTSRPDEGKHNTSDYINIGYSTNVYDAPNARDDDNTTVYTSLGFYTNAH